MRFGRFAVPDLTATLPGYKFEIGKGVTMRDGKDVTIAATGFMVHVALEAAELLAAEGIDARVLNIHTVKPIDSELLIKAAKETGAIVTAEEHNVIGGFGSAVAEVVCEGAPVPVVRVGVEDKFGKSGKVPELLEEYGLTAANIAAKAKAAIALKK
jgi:transketolase